MFKHFGIKSAVILLGATLLGGVIIATPNSVTTTEAQAQGYPVKPEKYFKSDIAKSKAAVALGSTRLKSKLNAKYFKEFNKYCIDGYSNRRTPSFSDVGWTIGIQGTTDVDKHATDVASIKQDAAALSAYYKIFRGRMTKSNRSDGDRTMKLLNKDLAKARYDTSDKQSMLENDFQSMAEILGFGGISNIRAGIYRTYFTKLSVKRVSKNYIKVSGKFNEGEAVNYVRVKTAKGNKYIKVGDMNFNKKVYAPNTKTVKVSLGLNASDGMGFEAIPKATKTVHVK